MIEMDNEIKLTPDKIIKRFTAIQISTVHSDEKVKIKLSYGKIETNSYSNYYPDEDFATEEEAYQWAFNFNPYAKWLIVPLIQFRK